MHPEIDIARKFWVYVAVRAHGDAVNRFPWPQLVVAKEEEEYDTAADLAPLEPAGTHDVSAVPIWDGTYNEDTGLPPRAFPTLQEALYDFLLAHVGESEIAFSYGIWLRAIAVILGDSIREPGRLTVTVAKSRYLSDPISTVEMSISDDWSVLSRHTFDYVCRRWKELAP